MKLRKLTPWPLVAILAFALASCSLERSRRLFRKNTLWKIKSKTSTVYLQGSIHLLKKEAYPLDDRIEKAFRDSEALVLEVDLKAMNDPGTQALMLAKALLPQGQTLADTLEPELYELARKKTSEVGMSMPLFDKCKPWFLAMTLATMKLRTLGFDPAYGVDMHFFLKAQEEGKDIIGLETLEYQLSLFDAISAEDEDALLEQTLKDLDVLEKEVESIVGDWLSGNVDGLEKTLLKSFAEYPNIRETLVTQRNREWVLKIESFLQQERNVMVIVGAMHLPGKAGVLELLRRKGYALKQL